MSDGTPIKKAPGWRTATKPCGICDGSISWHFHMNDPEARTLNEPRQNACVECDPDGWGYPNYAATWAGTAA